MSGVDSEPDTVSVAMATYNGAAFIIPLLASLAMQTRLPDELVVGDDGSTDDTVGHLRAFAATAPFPVRIIENSERLGYRRNFLATGKACAGSLVFFCDQDDVWEPEKIARMAGTFADPSVLLAYHNALVVSADLKSRSALYRADEQRFGIEPDAPQPFHFSLGFTQAYRRRLHDFDDLWPMSIDHVDRRQRLAHDQWFFLLALTIGRVAYVDERLVHYRQHTANVYGVGRDATRNRSLLGRIAQALVAPVWADRARSEGAMARSRVMAAIAARTSGREHHAASAYAERYAQLAARLDRRDKSAYGALRAERLGALMANVLDHAYGRRTRWQFHACWMVGDVARSIRGATRATP